MSGITGSQNKAQINCWNVLPSVKFRPDRTAKLRCVNDARTNTRLHNNHNKVDIAFEFLASDVLADRKRLTNEIADSVISLRVRRKHKWFDLGDFK